MTDVMEIQNVAGSSNVVLLCEHASNNIPEEFSRLGLTAEARISHAAWDPGARELTLSLSKILNATAILSKISRLVYDCNRPPDAPSAIPEKSELIEIPGNVGLSQVERDARAHMVYEPFCEAVSNVLDARGPDAVLVTVHSFTPIYYGKPRAVEIGLLHDAESELVDAMLKYAGELPARRIERNAPYGPEDGVTHSLKRHALSRGLANVMIEVRNDLLRTSDDVALIATEILSLLRPALNETTRMENSL